MKNREALEEAFALLGEQVRDASIRPVSPDMLEDVRRLTAALSETLDAAAQLPASRPALRLVE